MKQKELSSKINIEEENPYLKYDVSKLIGQGQYGKVFKAYRKSQNIKNDHSNVFAIKIIPTSKLRKNPKLKELLQNQVQILCTLKHRNIINFEEMFVWEKKIYMVYEYCEGGDLENRIPLPEPEILPIAKRIISACVFAAKFSIIHRDLKPANILFKDGKVKVADWGFSRFLKGKSSAESFIGSPAYMAPQILKQEQYSSKADVWSFGMMIYQCLTGDFPWNGKSIKKLLESIQSKPLDIPNHISPILKQILKSSLVMNPKRRSSFEDLLSLFPSKRIENPEMDQSLKSEVNELSCEQVKKCSFYLQMAKRMNNFSQEEARNICLEVIIQNLQKMEHIKNSPNSKSQLLPSSPKNIIGMTIKRGYDHQWDIFEKPRTMTTIKSHNYISSKKIKKSSQQSETLSLLKKQIQLIKKIQSQTSTPNFSSFLVCNSENKLIKALINAILREIEPLEIQISKQTRQKKQKKLVQMNCMLDIIMYKQLPDDYKNNHFNTYFSELQNSSRSMLIKLLNHKILYINKKYCRL